MASFALEFPPISHLVEWPAFLFEDSPFAVNKVTLVFLFALVCTLSLFIIGGRRQALVPTGVQNLVESSVDFIREGVVMQTMGHDGLTWVPFLTSLFFFIFFTNITGIIPVMQMPANARMAMPIVFAVMIWVLFIAVGIKHQGPFGYVKSVLFPPGVPKALYVLVTPIEFISTFLVRPFSLAVRLFANLLAGHILLVTFGVLAAALWAAKPTLVIVPLPFLMLVFLTGFEVLVAFLQAYIFTILAAVYIGGAMHPEH
ncbi:MAG: F0F1 ATP synthase subunit A [Actinobacteria bacterium]|nr:F0F1 ATP synthase subunit A [Actinomycetota bacterium]